MTLQMFNIWYFVYLFLNVGIILGVYFGFKNKSDKVKNGIIIGLLVFNLALHFIKCAFPPYNGRDDALLYYMWPTNISGAIVYIFPIIYLSKSKSAKDFMFVLGVISGALTILYPSSRFGENALSFDIIRFYVCHLINFLAPFLMVAWKLHKLSYKNFWKTPLYICGTCTLVFVVVIIMSETGLGGFRNSNFLVPNYDNKISLWFPTNGDAVGKMLDLFCPKFLKTVWSGPYVGQTKYVPLLWMFPGFIIFGIVAHLILCLPIEFNKNIKNWFKRIFTKKSKYEVIG